MSQSNHLDIVHLYAVNNRIRKSRNFTLPNIIGNDWEMLLESLKYGLTIPAQSKEIVLQVRFVDLGSRRWLP